MTPAISDVAPSPYFLLLAIFHLSHAYLRSGRSRPGQTKFAT